MPCGCKKKKEQEVPVTQTNVVVTESKFISQEPVNTLTPEQQQQVDVIVEKIEKLSSN